MFKTERSSISNVDELGFIFKQLDRPFKCAVNRENQEVHHLDCGYASRQHSGGALPLKVIYFYRMDCCIQLFFTPETKTLLSQVLSAERILYQIKDWQSTSTTFIEALKADLKKVQASQTHQTRALLACVEGKIKDWDRSYRQWYSSAEREQYLANISIARNIKDDSWRSIVDYAILTGMSPRDANDRAAKELKSKVPVMTNWNKSRLKLQEANGPYLVTLNVTQSGPLPFLKNSTPPNRLLEALKDKEIAPQYYLLPAHLHRVLDSSANEKVSLSVKDTALITDTAVALHLDGELKLQDALRCARAL